MLNLVGTVIEAVLIGRMLRSAMNKAQPSGVAPEVMDGDLRSPSGLHVGTEGASPT